MWTARRWAEVGALAVVLAAPVAWACGPFFPERMLLDRSASVLRAPRARFADEVAALKVSKPAVGANWAADEEYRKQTIEADLAELKAALAGKQDAEVIAGRYAAAREMLKELQSRAANGSGGRQTPLAVPAGLPAEFADYLEGAIAWASHDRAAAQKAWERLLARPAPERRFKSTWAAYMLGRLHHEGDGALARRRYQEARSLASQGFRDALGLAAASLGQEAGVELSEGNFGRSAQLYLEAAAAGDPYAAASLRFLAWKLLKADADAQKKALSNVSVRRVLVAHLAASDLSGLEKNSVEARLLSLLLAQTRGERGVEGADRLAWIAYQRGDTATADEWLRRAPEGSPVAAWIRSKLLLRQGKVDDAAKALTSAVAAFPLDASKHTELWDEFDGFAPSQRLRGELAVLKLARSQFTDALSLLLQAGYWRDAAQVAERVLTLDELRSHVDSRWPEPKAPPPKDGEERGFDTATQLRYLLARRLARAGRWKEARPYYPPEMRAHVDAHLASQEKARDSGQKSELRADALWSMAQLERKLGMELLGTEVAPDWHVDSGQFDEDAQMGKPAGRERLPLLGAAERQRTGKSAPAPLKRFHYRYTAAAHALEASRLLPDRSAKVGEMLCTAYRWLSARDPKAARAYASEARKRRSPCP